MAGRLALFYHIWAPEGPHPWTLLVDEQLRRILGSGLADHADIFCGIAGPACEPVSRLVSLYEFATIIAKSEDGAEFEGFTLKLLYEAARAQKYDAIGYIHTKGLSHSGIGGDPRIYRATNSWRHMMELAVLDRWREAITRLETHEAAGAIFRQNPWPHFSGNFWWARAKYIAGLPHPVRGEFPETQQFDHLPDLKARTNYERWIGINNPVAYDFYNRPFRFQGKRLTAGDDFDLMLQDVGPYYLTNLR
jgi:hypothetical protein